VEFGELHRQPELPSLERWQLQTAKAQFSEVFRRTRERARRVVTKQGKEAVTRNTKDVAATGVLMFNP
jgi:hypothetical protein